MNDNSLVTVENRSYISPDVAVGETNQFIDNLRQIQQQGNEQISAQTRALGSDVPISRGGLSGAGGTWTARFQTPQVQSMISDLRATTQATALQQQLSNLLAQKQQQYKAAYRAAYKKKEAESKKSLSDLLKGLVDDKPSTQDGTAYGRISGELGKTIVGDEFGNKYVEGEGWDNSGAEQTKNYDNLPFQNSADAQKALSLLDLGASILNPTYLGLRGIAGTLGNMFGW